MRSLVYITFASSALLAACGGSAEETASHKGDASAMAMDHDMAGGMEMAPETATAPSGLVDNFVLLDQRGDAHELYYHFDAPAIVMMVQGNGCPIVRNAWSDFTAVREEFEGQGVKFFMLNANSHDSRDEIAAEAADFGIDLPILKDETQLIAASLDVTRTAEVLVIDPTTWKIAYRGPVNNRLGYGQQRSEASGHYLKDALTSVIAGQPVAAPARAAKGCIVNLNVWEEPAPTAISYAEAIAPMLKENCVACHQDGGIGPWQMTDYETVRGFAPMIREVVRTKRMPPWSADPAIGDFHNTRGLTAEEQRTLIRWIEAGAPRGDGADPLKERLPDAEEWPLGPPDMIVEAPAFEVPASGIVDYQFPTALNPLTENKWIKAVTVVPGDRTVVHHALVGSSTEITPPGEGDDGDVFDNYLIGYVPGAESYVYPEGTGVEVEAGGEFRFQMHYTPSGKVAVDKTKLGLYFHDAPPKYRLRQQVVVDMTIAIPPHDPNYVDQAYFEFDHPATIYMLFPHAHFRGKASKFTVVYPDGEEELLLSVPRYDFNWQHTYALKEPLNVPAGARLVHEWVYDNSDKNFANPDPTRTVPWGLQSADEMLYGSFFFRWTEETEDNPVHDRLVFNLRQYFGMADRNMDGEIQKDEAFGGFAESWEAGRLDAADANKNGAFSFAEFHQFQLARRQQRQQKAQEQAGD